LYQLPSVSIIGRLKTQSAFQATAFSLSVDIEEVL
jgi:hypothetical protein